jgi:hypothetical protein
MFVPSFVWWTKIRALPSDERSPTKKGCPAGVHRLGDANIYQHLFFSRKHSGCEHHQHCNKLVSSFHRLCQCQSYFLHTFHSAIGDGVWKCFPLDCCMTKSSQFGRASQSKKLECKKLGLTLARPSPFSWRSPKRQRKSNPAEYRAGFARGCFAPTGGASCCCNSLTRLQ